MIWSLWRKGIRNVHSIKYCRSKYLTVPVFGQEPLLVAASGRTPLGHGGSVTAVAVLPAQRALWRLQTGPAPTSSHKPSMPGCPGSAPVGKQHQAGDGKQSLTRNTHFNSSQTGAVKHSMGLSFYPQVFATQK